ncbi:hypothetical protein GYMLUDRAFT_886428 [Collybiopsis luxurians FD-317 M1]|uniref:F-box domain-containing protein n=1 Tax=Collybiopsis luxurians FD-317 M1 TaxID=944289 RepID=A0A0D0BJV5_9AGAR|nr:hypothetical protein GYMLUDRAFT_886428 [Collybiopsis luxurians FD-317 M1]
MDSQLTISLPHDSPSSEPICLRPLPVDEENHPDQRFEYLKIQARHYPYHDDLSAFAECPDSVWLDIIDRITECSALYNFILASSRFYRLGIRALYRRVQFQKFSDIQNNFGFWVDRKDDIASATTALFLGGNASAASTNLSRFCLGRFNCEPENGIVLKHWNVLPAQILRFTKLEQLRFNAIPLPSQFCDLLVELPLLRALCITECSLEPVMQGWSMILPITELTLKSVKPFNWPRISGMVVRQDSLRFCFPGTLEYLELRTFSQENWPRISPSQVESLTMLLNASSSLRTLRINGYLHNLQFNSEVPSVTQLKTYVGPLISITSLSQSYHSLEDLLITDYDQPIHSFTKVFTPQPRLRTLKLFLAHWDVEIMHAVVHLFPNLEELKILYQIDYPNADLLLSIGAEFLSRFPALTKFHLYNPRVIHPRAKMEHHHKLPRSLSQIELGPCADPEFVSDGEFLAAWERHTPQLREVRLVKDFVWRRDLGSGSEQDLKATSRDLWYKRAAGPLEKEFGAIRLGWKVDPEF